MEMAAKRCWRWSWSVIVLLLASTVDECYSAIQSFSRPLREGVMLHIELSRFEDDKIGRPVRDNVNKFMDEAVGELERELRKIEQTTRKEEVCEVNQEDVEKEEKKVGRGDKGAAEVEDKKESKYGTQLQLVTDKMEIKGQVNMPRKLWCKKWEVGGEESLHVLFCVEHVTEEQQQDVVGKAEELVEGMKATLRMETSDTIWGLSMSWCMSLSDTHYIRAVSVGVTVTRSNKIALSEVDLWKDKNIYIQMYGSSSSSSNEGFLKEIDFMKVNKPANLPWQLDTILDLVRHTQQISEGHTTWKYPKPNSIVALMYEENANVRMDVIGTLKLYLLDVVRTFLAAAYENIPADVHPTRSMPVSLKLGNAFTLAIYGEDWRKM